MEPWSYGERLPFCLTMLSTNRGQIWDLLEGRPLFQALDPESNTYTADGHLQEMVSLLGPPPKDLLLRGKLTSQFFCPEGTC